MAGHITVLKNESIDALQVQRNSTIVDATANGGGHSLGILEKLSLEGQLISIDVDTASCTLLRERFAGKANTTVIHGNFRNIDSLLHEAGFSRVDGILADLGWSTNQFETNEGYAPRGFSFAKDEPLFMTYGEPDTYPFTARDIVNRWDEEDIANVLYGYGDERNSRKIARAIVEAREKKYIGSSAQLAGIVEESMKRKGRIHPATKTFQALRIAVNDELAALSDFIEKAFTMLAPGGRLAIITFHSTEDRIVKTAFKSFIAEGVARSPIKKPLTPSRIEQKANPRSRSAKLRILEKI
jgi:16S rRNA (cytosine1402-N4)-methyltransferase